MTKGERHSRQMWKSWHSIVGRELAVETLNSLEYTKPSDFWFWVCGLEPAGGTAADFVQEVRDQVHRGYNPEAQVDKLSQENRIELQRLRHQWEQEHGIMGGNESRPPWDADLAAFVRRGHPTSDMNVGSWYRSFKALSIALQTHRTLDEPFLRGVIEGGAACLANWFESLSEADKRQAVAWYLREACSVAADNNSPWNDEVGERLRDGWISRPDCVHGDLVEILASVVGVDPDGDISADGPTVPPFPDWT